MLRLMSGQKNYGKTKLKISFYLNKKKKKISKNDFLQLTVADPIKNYEEQ